MLLKIICALCVVCGAWYAGYDYVKTKKEEIKLADDYVLLLSLLAEKVGYSSVNMYDFFSSCNIGQTKRFTQYVYSYKDSELLPVLDSFVCKNATEQKCIEIIKGISVIQCCNDAEKTAQIITERKEMLLQLKKTIEEEYRAKIKTVPELSLIVGIFAAVLII